MDLNVVKTYFKTIDIIVFASKCYFNENDSAVFKY